MLSPNILRNDDQQRKRWNKYLQAMLLDARRRERLQRRLKKTSNQRRRPRLIFRADGLELNDNLNYLNKDNHLNRCMCIAISLWGLLNNHFQH